MPTPRQSPRVAPLSSSRIPSLAEYGNGRTRSYVDYRTSSSEVGPLYTSRIPSPAQNNNELRTYEDYGSIATEDGPSSTSRIPSPTKHKSETGRSYVDYRSSSSADGAGKENEPLAGSRADYYGESMPYALGFLSVLTPSSASRKQAQEEKWHSLQAKVVAAKIALAELSLKIDSIAQRPPSSFVPKGSRIPKLQDNLLKSPLVPATVHETHNLRDVVKIQYRMGCIEAKPANNEGDMMLEQMDAARPMTSSSCDSQ